MTVERFRQIGTGVYLIRNKRNGKLYVGSSALSLRRRQRDHWSYLSANRHHNRYLQRAWNEHGADAFEFVILEYCLRDDCLAVEQFWIDEFHSAEAAFGYNLNPKAESRLESKATPETRAKISAAVKARTPEHHARHSQKLKGMRMAPEDVARRAESLKQAYASGRRKPIVYTEELRKKQGNGTRGKKRSAEYCARVSAALTGRPVKPETRAKIGAGNAIAHLGMKRSAEHRASISAAFKGKDRPELQKLTKEQVAEIRRRHVARDPVNGGMPLAREFGVHQSSVSKIVRGKMRQFE